jgi:uncharacterized protein (TIGR03000 family)
MGPGSTPGSSMLLPAESSGLLTLHVPYAAKVFINGQETRSVGSKREYVSSDLEQGKTYPYTVSALVLCKGPAPAQLGTENVLRVREDNPQWLWLTKTVYLRAGQRVGVAFSDDPQIDTKLADMDARRVYGEEQQLKKDIRKLHENIKKQREDRIRQAGLAANLGN